MECNKGEAERAIEIADKKLTEKDVMGAKKFAMKAQSLYPGVEKLDQLLSTLDIYMSAENKIGGETDWYGVLGVAPDANDATIKTQYRRLALVLHPDKNKLQGAGGAFQLLQEAWTLLSDKTKRSAYDRNRNKYVRHNVVHQKVPTATRGSQGANGSVCQKASTTTRGSQGASDSVDQKASTATWGTQRGKGSVNQKSSTASGDPQGANGSSDVKTTQTKTSGAKTQKGTKRAAHSSAVTSFDVQISTIWSKCPRCKMRLEYMRQDKAFNVFCPNCNKIFLAVEIAPPACDSESTTPANTGSSAAASGKVGDTGFVSRVSFTAEGVHWVPFSRDADTSQGFNSSFGDQQAFASGVGTSKGAKAARVDQQASASTDGTSKAAKASSQGKWASGKGKKDAAFEEECQKANEDLLWATNDVENAKRYNTRIKDSDANRRKEG